jgi:Trk K+ transport system NAD-binding subunit
MHRSSKRLLLLTATLPVVLVILGGIYQQGMIHLEGRPRSLGASIGWAAETLTTTGYGHDNVWQHPLMQMFVVVAQFGGVLLIFLIFPVFLIPFLEERFEGRLPSRLPALRGHVVIYRWGPGVATLAADLERAKIPVIIFEEDEATARRLRKRGKAVVFASTLDDDPDLTNLRGARGVVANGSDHQNGVFTMTARQHGYTGKVVALIENPRRRGAMTKAGADAVFTPKHALAAVVAARASAKISPRVSGAPMLGDALAVGEVRIDRGSSLAGKTLAGSKIGAETGAQVIGRWVGGDLVQPTPSMVLDAGTILVAVGSSNAIDALSRLATPVRAGGPFVVCGFGDTGKKIVELLTDAGEQVVVVNDEVAPQVTHAGDPLDPDLLARAGAASAQAVILALEDDTETAFAAAIVRGLSSETLVIATADNASSVSRIRSAGADFCFSVGQVAAQLASFQLLGEQSMSLQPRIKIVKTRPGSLVGSAALAGDIRRRTGCSIVAVERDGAVHVDLEALTLASGDAVYVAGSEEALDAYLDMFDAR